MVLSLDSSGETWMMISTLSPYLSSTFLILILPLSLAFDDRILDRLGGRGIGYFGDGERAFVDLRNLGAHLHRPARRPSL